MANYLSKTVILFFLLFAVAANAATETAPPIELQRFTQGIALAPILPAEKITIENRGGPLDVFGLPWFIAKRSMEQDRATLFGQLLQAQSLNLSDEILAALRIELMERGLQVVDVEHAKYLPDDPRVLDYKNTKTASDMILTANVFDVGLFSGRFTTKYVPRLNVTFDLVSKNTEESVYSQSIYYGADARKVAADQIPADQKYAYESFEQAMANQRGVAESLREGIRKVARLVAQQILEIKK